MTAILMVTLAAGCSSGKRPTGGGTTTTAPKGSAKAKAPAPDFSAGKVDFRDEEAGFSISFPKGWKQFKPKDAGARLVATPNGADSLLVRISRLEAGVGVAQVKDYSNNLLADQGLTIEDGPTDVEHGGLSGYAYRYTFADSEAQAFGRHAHYFLFKPKDSLLYTIVLQALPLDDFPRLAPVFDQILKSFQVFEGTGIPETPSTTAPASPPTSGG